MYASCGITVYVCMVLWYIMNKCASIASDILHPTFSVVGSTWETVSNGASGAITGCCYTTCSSTQRRTLHSGHLNVLRIYVDARSQVVIPSVADTLLKGR